MRRTTLVRHKKRLRHNNAAAASGLYFSSAAQCFIAAQQSVAGKTESALALCFDGSSVDNAPFPFPPPDIWPLGPRH